MSNEIAVINDVHLGVRQDSPIFHNNNRKFYSTVFFPELKKRDIKTLIIAGDLWDRRKFNSYYTINEAKEYFFEPLYDNKIETYIVVGNHDIFLRESLDINSPSLLFQEYDNLHTIDNPQTLSIHNTWLCFLPWICADNYEETVNEIQNTPAEYCFGHLEVQGFSMYKDGEPSKHGFPSDLFKKFKMVFTGHYHTRSFKENIHYMGAAGEYTWSDYNDHRGFNIFDVDTKEMTFIENPYTLFTKLWYNDVDGVDGGTDFRVSDVKEKFVKVYVEKKNDHKVFDKYMQKIYNSSPYDVKVLNDFSAFEEATVSVSNINLENTQEILGKYVDSVETEVDKMKIKNYLKNLYIEAFSSDFGSL